MARAAEEPSGGGRARDPSPAPGEEPDRALYERLVREHGAALYRFAYWVSGRSALAEDLVQETYLEAWRGIASLRDPDAARPCGASPRARCSPPASPSAAGSGPRAGRSTPGSCGSRSSPPRTTSTTPT